MHILISAATPFEIQPVIDLLTKSPSRGNKFDIGILFTGIGSVAATWSLMHQIGRRRPDLVIQAGIAGSFTANPPSGGSNLKGERAEQAQLEAAAGQKDLPAKNAYGQEVEIGQVVVIGQEVMADLGVWENGQFRNIFDLKLTQPNEPPFTNQLLINPYHKLLELTRLPVVRGITVNEITTSATRISWYQQNLSPVVESMEGGALHFVCLQEKIAFCQFRAISNTIGERDKTKWDIKAAIGALNQEIVRFLERLAESENNVLDPNK